MKSFFETYDLILMEMAVVERLRRHAGVQLHPRLEHAPLLYDERGRRELAAIYQGYLDIVGRSGRPMMICTPTWRANRERVLESGISRQVNADAARFLCELRDRMGPGGPPVKIGGMMGCRNDCYRPEEGLAPDEAMEFHAWQVEQLAASEVDFLVAETLPAVPEAAGIAALMAATKRPYLISFVINRQGRVLDGTGLQDAVDVIDGEVSPPPLGYMVNCAHPSFLRADRQPRTLFSRLIGYVANASSLDHAELEDASEVQADDIPLWGDEMMELNRRYGVKILGGCCGTGDHHLNYLIANQ